MERPTLLDASLRLAHRCPVADARQIFEGNAAPGVLGLRDRLFGDAVVDIRGKPMFLATTFLEQAVRRFRVLG